MFSKDKRLLAKLRTSDLDFTLSVASDPSISSKVLDHLATSSTVEVRVAVSSNGSATERALYGLGHDPDRSVRAAALQSLLGRAGIRSASLAARRSNTSPQLLGVIAEDLSEYSAELRGLCGTGRHSDEDARREFPAPRAEVLAEFVNVRNPAARAEVAKSGAVTSSILTSLANDPAEVVRLAVATNDATPPSTLQALLKDSSENVRKRALANRSLPQEEITSVVHDESPDVRQQLAHGAGTAPNLLAQLALDDAAGVRKAVVQNANTPDAVLLRLASDPDVEVRMAVALGVGTVQRFTSFSTREAYARATPVEALLTLAGDSQPSVRMTVASAPRLPIDAFIELASDSDSRVREHVGTIIRYGYGEPIPGSRNSPVARGDGRATFPTDALHRLADNPDPTIRRAVAQHTQIPAFLLGPLLDDQRVFDWDGEDRKKPWSERTIMPYSVLRERAWDSIDDWWVLARVSNPKARMVLAFLGHTPVEILEELSTDADESVRSALLENRQLPVQAFRALIDDPSEVVAIRARTAFEKSVRRFHDHLDLFVDANAVGVRAAVAGTEGAPAELLERLARDVHPVVRTAVATNPGTLSGSLVLLASDSEAEVVDAVVGTIKRNRLASETLEALASSQSAKVRQEVASTHSLPEGALEALINDPDETVRRAAAANGFHFGAALVTTLLGEEAVKGHGIGQQKVAKLVSLAERPDASNDALHSLAQSPFIEVRGAVAAHPAASGATLANLTRDQAATVRAAIARNPSVSQEVLTMLARDDAAEVRREVAANPSSPSVVLAILDRDPDDDVVLALALHPNITSGSLDALVEVHCQPKVNDLNSRLLSTVRGTHPLLEALDPWKRQLRERLLRSDHRWQQGARQAVASNPLASTETLVKLAQQPDTVAFVAANPNTPRAVLTHLVASPDELVREAVADNPSTTESELALLALDQREGVRFKVASNPRTSIETLEILVGDFGPRVKEAAMKVLSNPRDDL